MSLWDITTQPLPGLTTSPETFANYLQRHHLSCVEAARIAALPASLVWRAAHWLPIAEMSARLLAHPISNRRAADSLSDRTTAGAINTSLGPLLMHIIPHDLMERVMSVASTGQTLCNVISVSLAGLLGSLLGGLHANLLGISFGTYDTIYVVTGLLFVLGAFYAMVNVRGLKISTEQQEESQAV